MKKAARLVVMTLSFLIIPSPVFAEPPRLCELQNIAVNSFNFLMAVLPFIALVVLGYGSWLWMTSSGNPQKLQQAKDTLVYGILGFVLGLSAVLIVLTIETFFIDTEAEDGVFRWSDGAGAIVSVDLCEKKDNGASCSSDAECKSGYCDSVNNTCGYPVYLP